MALFNSSITEGLTFGEKVADAGSSPIRSFMQGAQLGIEKGKLDVMRKNADTDKMKAETDSFLAPSTAAKNSAAAEKDAVETEGKMRDQAAGFQKYLLNSEGPDALAAYLEKAYGDTLRSKVDKTGAVYYERVSKEGVVKGVIMDDSTKELFKEWNSNTGKDTGQGKSLYHRELGVVVPGVEAEDGLLHRVLPNGQIDPEPAGNDWLDYDTVSQEKLEKWKADREEFTKKDEEISKDASNAKKIRQAAALYTDILEGLDTNRFAETQSLLAELGQIFNVDLMQNQERWASDPKAAATVLGNMVLGKLTEISGPISEKEWPIVLGMLPSLQQRPESRKMAQLILERGMGRIEEQQRMWLDHVNKMGDDTSRKSLNIFRQRWQQYEDAYPLFTKEEMKAIRAEAAKYGETARPGKEAPTGDMDYDAQTERKKLLEQARKRIPGN